MKNKIRRATTPLVPKVGDKIYVNSSFSISNGSSDVVGGLSTVTEIDRKYGNIFISVKEHPGRSYNWEILQPEQSELRKEFGRKKAYPDPALDTPWIEDGDTVNGHVYHGRDIW